MESMKEIMNYLPKEVIIAILIVVLLTEATKKGLKLIEIEMEKKKGKEIKFFDHTKVIFVTVWSLIASALLAIGNVYTWTQCPMYWFVIFGASVACYEYIVKRIDKLWD